MASSYRGIIFLLLVGLTAIAFKDTLLSVKGINSTFIQRSSSKDEKQNKTQLLVDYAILSDLNRMIFPVLTDLQRQKFYRTLKVPADKTCLYFNQDEHAICKNKSCSVCRCESEEVPILWRKEDQNECFIKEKESEDKGRLEDKYDWYWSISHDDDYSNEGEYVDLIENIEGYTANKEPNIWKIIYIENCFQGSSLNSEKAILNQLISGFHASVSSHICEFYQNFADDKPVFKPNWEMYFEKVGNYPERIISLAFYFEVLLRAIDKSSQVFQNFPYNTGDQQSDTQVRKLIKDVTNQINRQGNSLQFDKYVFHGQDSADIKKNYQKYIKNIAQIMDCVSCEKCKLFAKMQVQGITLSLNILFADNSDERLKDLKRNELIILLNTLHKCAESMQIIDKMFERRYNYYSTLYLSTVGCTLLLSLGVILLIGLKKQSNTKEKMN